MAFNSLLKLLLELPNQASWARSTSEVNLNKQQVGFWRVPGKSFFVKNRFKFKERGYFVQKMG